MKKSMVLLSVLSLFMCVQAKAQETTTRVVCLYASGYYGNLRVYNSPSGKSTNVDANIPGTSHAEQLGYGESTNLRISFKPEDCSLDSGQLSGCKGRARVKFYNLGFHLEKSLDSALMITPTAEGHIVTITVQRDGVVANQTHHFQKVNGLPQEGCQFF